MSTDPEVGISPLTRGPTLTTDAHGLVHLTVHPQTTTFYSWHFVSTATYANVPVTTAYYSQVTVRYGMRAGLSSGSNYVPKGKRVRLSGATSTTQRGRSAVVEWFHDGHWYALGHATVASNGSFSFLLPPAPYGAYYRVHLAATTGHPFSRSNPVLMRVSG